MKNWIKVVIVVLCIVVLGAIYFIVSDMKGKVDNKKKNENTVTNTSNTANVIANTTATPTNVVQNKVEATPTVAATPEPTEAPIDTNSEETDITELANEDERRNEAIELAKRKWGEDDDSVYFTNEGKNEDDEYLVSVRSKTTTFIEVTFKVNLETKKVTADI